jgi:hypothetical protein
MRSLSNLLAGGGQGFQWDGSKNILGGFILFTLCDRYGFNPGVIGMIEAPERITGFRWFGGRLLGER